MSEAPLIQFEHVGVSFGQTVIHRDISFSVNESEVLTLLGPSGAGKTVLLKLLIGLLYPTSGRVLVEGYDISLLSERDLRLLRRDIGFLFQGAALFDSLTVYENVAFSLREHGETDEDKIENVVMDKLRIVGLPQLAQRLPSQLSGGQKKRIGLARALASSPRVVLFDEPTTGLDPTSRDRIDELITTLRDNLGITSLVVTHDMESAKRISDRVLLISGGLVVVDGTAPRVWTDAPEVRKFVDGRWED
jgi:phospholipid/cholesterol/gamma-HCH transport system ATP-binding protein